MKNHLRWVFALIAAVGIGAAVIWAQSSKRSAPRSQAGDGPSESEPKPNPAPPPDLLLITIDTLRADHLGAYGYEKAETPTIDALAKRGVLFTNATTPIPLTTPAIASLFTGLWPHNHGSRDVMRPLKEGRVLAEILGENGYETLAVVNTPAVGPAMNLNRGFDTFVSKEELGKSGGTEASFVTERALELVAGARSDAPMFLWVQYYDPHLPYFPPKKWMPDNVEPLKKLRKLFYSGEITVGQIHTDHEGIASGMLETMVSAYDGEIAYTDHAVGALLDGVNKARAERPSLVTLTADHGEMLGEAGLYYEHGTHLHDAALRVPLIMAGRGVPEGKRDTQMARLEDLAPTLLALLDIDRGQWPEFDAVDLGPRLRGEESPEPRVAFAETGGARYKRFVTSLQSGRPGRVHCLNDERFSLCTQPDGKQTLYDRKSDPELETDVSDKHPQQFQRLQAADQRWPHYSARKRAARTERFKLVAYPRIEGGYRQELYDLRDGTENEDVTAEHPKIAKNLAEQLKGWFDQVPAYRPTVASDQQLRALRALGYIK